MYQNGLYWANLFRYSQYPYIANKSCCTKSSVITSFKVYCSCDSLQAAVANWWLSSVVWRDFPLAECFWVVHSAAAAALAVLMQTTAAQVVLLGTAAQAILLWLLRNSLFCCLLLWPRLQAASARGCFVAGSCSIAAGNTPPTLLTGKSRFQFSVPLVEEFR